MNVRWMAGLSAMLCASVLLFASSATAAEEETHLFDAELSLTGNCTTATVDPVPDPSCPDEPTQAFVKHGAVAVDAYGNRYVGSTGGALTSTKGRVDVFDSSGEFITRIENIKAYEFEMSLAVDSEGYLYVARELSGEEQDQRLLRYKPTKYDPAAGEIEYGEAPVAIGSPVESGRWNAFYLSIAVDPTNNHLFVQNAETFWEFSSAAEGNASLGSIVPAVQGGGSFSGSFALDSVHKRIYVADLREKPAFGVPTVVRAYNLEAPHEELFVIDGSTTPTNRFVSAPNLAPVAIDEETGHIFVGDLEAPTPRVYEFDADGNPVSTLGEGLLNAAGVGLVQMAYDDSLTSPTQRYLFVPSDKNPGRSLAFAPKPSEEPPAVEAVSTTGVTTSDAILRATVNPDGLATTYRFEYLTEQVFEENGKSFAGAAVAGEGELEPAGEGLVVSAVASGLQPGTSYRFRVVAENALGEDEGEGGFATFDPVEVSTDCLNQALRTGPSALLPDCRAYELVTPADTNGRPPLGASRSLGTAFINHMVSPAGDRVPFRIEGGALPGLEGTGSMNSDPYLASRTPGGWSTSYVGPPAAFAADIVPGTGSPDKGYFFWFATGSYGPALLYPNYTAYVRYPDGHSELLGQGSIGTDLGAGGELISSGGEHIIIQSGAKDGSGGPPVVQLEPDAAPGRTGAVYDRTPDGTLRVVSMKPGGEPFNEGEHASYIGASLDGTGVAFRVGGTLYFRHDNAETFMIGNGVAFAGVAEGGDRLFYVEGGNLEAFDVATEGRIDFSTSGDVTPVITSADGTAAYFMSETAIAESGPNPGGAEPQPGEQNLYLSREGEIEFVATVTDRDVEGREDPGTNAQTDGLGVLLSSLPNEKSRVPAQTSADGAVLLFKARAALTGYDTADHAQIYRYDSAAGDLRCISCSPTGAAPASDATLQSEDRSLSGPKIDPVDWLENLRADGRRAFFETAEGLVARDVDGRNDVYEWEDQGVGSCLKPDGCLYLISSGQSGGDEYLYGVSESGDDVFILSSDLLAGGDVDNTRSIYDARVGGGFPPPSVPAGECLGEACQPAAVAPNDPTPASSAFEGTGNVAPERSVRKHCPKGKKAVRRGGKVRCVPRKGKHRKSTKRANHNGRAGR